MKKTAVLVLGLVLVGFVVAPALAAAHEDELKTIKKAVKENPAAQAGKEAQWFKILVVDNKTNKETVKITVPLGLVEILLGCADNKHLRMDKHECDIDLQTVLKQLRAAGPMAMVEINEDSETVKVWLE